MKMILKKLPLYAAIGSLVLSACSAVAERPEGVGRGQARDRDDDRREHRRDDDRRDERRGDYRRDDDRRDHRRDDDRRDERRGDYRRDDDRRERRGDDRSGPRVEVNIGGYFGDRHRTEVREYYREQSRGGHCPPGLAKKNNGCMPPGQARQWSMGQPLPRDVVYQPVEPNVRVRLGTPPAGHEFVRVAGDILLIAVGTAMVVDAIQDLGIGR